MLVDNIFKLVNKFSAEEDQLSANFGFLIKNDKQILNEFFKKINIDIQKKDLNFTDIETQVSYSSGKSIIDLQCSIPNKFLIFLESKIVATKLETIFKQLNKYRKILDQNRTEYEKIRLIYVSKYPISKNQKITLRQRLKLNEKEFYFFSWEDLLNLIQTSKEKPITKLFNNYIGDTMFNKKIIKEQKIKDVVEVLVIFTNQYFWEMSQQKYIAVQGNGSPDAQYIAFLRTNLPNGERSKITHIAEVEYTESNVPRKDMLKGLKPSTRRELLDHMEERNLDLLATHKQYVLKKGSIKSLPKPIEHFGPGPQVKFKTTMGKLLLAETTRDILGQEI